MSWTNSAALAGLVVASRAPAHAQALPRGVSPDDSACHARAHGGTVQEDLCTPTEMVAQDARLDKAYGQVMKRLASESAGRQNLRTLEQAWIKAAGLRVPEPRPHDRQSLPDG